MRPTPHWCTTVFPSDRASRVAPGTAVGKVSMTSDPALAVGSHWGQALYSSCMLARAAKCRETMRQNSSQFLFLQSVPGRVSNVQVNGPTGEHMRQLLYQRRTISALPSATGEVSTMYLWLSRCLLRSRVHFIYRATTPVGEISIDVSDTVSANRPPGHCRDTGRVPDTSRHTWVQVHGRVV